MKGTHTGWTEQEDRALLETVLNARRMRLPLKTAFDAIAERTDRLLTAVLEALAKGQSVRACTLEMANGDTRRMLRYQNKYRALLKTQPERVKKARAKLIAEGRLVPDPFVRDPDTPHVGRPPKAGCEMERSIRALLDTLYRNLIALTQGENAG